MNRTTLVLASSFITLFAHATAMSQEAASPRLVLKGHDPVAYFTDSKPVKGNPKISYDWDDGRYYFASTKNRDTFASDPDRYAPQFGGYCTGSMSRGVRNEGNPDAWVIVDGRLYVFGAPDDATAFATRRDYKEIAERDPILFAAKSDAASVNWRKNR